MYGLRYKSKNKWHWHRNADGNIIEFTKEDAERKAALWQDKTIAKAQKITSKSK